MKTIRKETIEPVYVDKMPSREKMVQGKLYVSKEYQATNHLCLCGCGEECYLPLDEDGWMMTKNEKGEVTLEPSILQKFACKSHYIITNNKANFV